MDKKTDNILISRIYDSFERCVPGRIQSSIETIIEEGVCAKGQVSFFFRADDIGVPSASFTKMMALFIKYKIQLCLAVVPAWLTRQRWERLESLAAKDRSLFCWHMHGYQHFNHEAHGKKQEFGPARSFDAVSKDLSKGRTRLESIIGNDFSPVFTPPWNRCSPVAMALLKNIGFKAISRNHGATPAVPEGLIDLPVHVDLHTRKERDAGQGWDNLLEEFKTGIVSNRACGIMIHHMRMNRQAFVFLEHLIASFTENPRIKLLSFSDLIYD